MGKPSDYPYPDLGNLPDPNDCGNLGKAKDCPIVANSVDWDNNSVEDSSPSREYTGS